MIDVLVIFVLILLNGVFSMAELAIASGKRLRLEQSSREGSGGARVALALADDPGAFLSTVQIGITLVSIFNGAFGAASLTAQLAPWLAKWQPLAPYARSVALAVVIFGITFASLNFGELVPKRKAWHYPERVAILAARPLYRLSRLMLPIVKVLSFTTELVVRLMGLRDREDTAPTQQEISGILKEGTYAGVLDKTEYDIVRRALRLDDQRLGGLMTPRIDLAFIDVNDDPMQNLVKIAASPYSRFPVLSQDRSHCWVSCMRATCWARPCANSHCLTLTLPAPPSRPCTCLRP